MLVGGVALAQQGLVVEPWGKAPTLQASPSSAPRSMPASGLGPAITAPRRLAALPQSAPQVPAEPQKWSPPVVELLVDPWAKELAAPAPRSRWVPRDVEIVDPWANEAAPEPPRVASRPAGATHATIF
jgi:hypothetical protein